MDADQVLVGLRGGARFTVPTGMEAALSRVVTVNGREQASRGAPRLRTELCVRNSS
jgi:hypothetical protein